MVRSSSASPRPRRAGRLAALVVAMLAAPAAAPPVVAQEPTADLAVTFWGVGDGRDAAGAATRVSLQVSNGGPANAIDVVLELRVPPATELLDDEGRCGVEPGLISCDIGELRAASGVSFSIPIRFDDAGTYDVELTARSQSTDPDGDDSRVTRAVTITEEEADLWFADSSERALTGAEHSVEHILWNRGPTNAGHIEITGSFPPEAEYVPGSLAVMWGSVDLTADLCTVTASGFTCDPHPGLQAGTGAYIRYVLVMPDEEGPIETSVTAIGRNDPEPSNNTGTVTLEVGVPVAELRLDLIAYGPARAEQPSAVTLWTWNVGDGPARDATATVVAPPGWVFSEPAPDEDGRACEVAAAGNEVTCTYDSIAPDTRRDLELTVLTPAGSGSATFEATVDTASPEVGTHPNDAAATVEYAPVGIDLVAVSAGHQPPTPVTGDERQVISFAYRFATPERFGDVDLSVTVELPPGVTTDLMEVEVVTSRTVCNLDPADATPTCPLQQLWVEELVVVRVHVRYAEPGVYTVTATANQAAEQAPGDETISHTVAVGQQVADLEVRATVDAEEVVVGQPYSYRVVVTNHGPEPVDAVTLRDAVPDGVEVVSATSNWFGTACDVVDDTVDCAMGAIRPGGSRRAVITLRPLVAGTFTSAATVSAPLEDPNPTNVSTEATVTAVEEGEASPVDLRLAWHAPRWPPLGAGRASTWTVLVANPGPRVATNVAVDLDAVTNLEVEAATHGWLGRACTPSGTSLCTIPAIPAGGVGFVTLRVVPNAAGPVSAEVSVDGDQPDPDPASNVLTITATTDPGWDL